MVAFAAPMITSAETITGSASLTADAQTQIQTLLAQIKTLQEQIKNIVASSTGGQGWGMGSSTGPGMPPGQMGKMACITLNRNLKQGDQGDDVKNLQQMLKDDSQSGFNGNVTGFFGPLTMKAMMHFQMNNGIASSTSGTVGPLTRGFFERRCGKGLDGMQGGQGQGGMGKMPPGAMNQSWAAGNITVNSTTSITIQTDGGPVVVNITASTTVHVFASNSTSTPPTNGSVSDLVVGKMARAIGMKNADGSIQAMIIDVGTTLPPPPMMKMDGEGQNGKPPMGIMPIMNGQGGGNYGPGGNNSGPQNW